MPANGRWDLIRRLKVNVAVTEPFRDYAFLCVDAAFVCECFFPRPDHVVILIFSCSDVLVLSL